MASWTDSVPQFNPYIPQLPVEAMVQVGMEKQRRYDEGLQKIQSYIDNIAGLDIIREVDRNYLQTKLNDLGSRLTTVAAGDFSNFQLVNSVSGMANQVVKDKNIQTAVSSTAWYRKQMAEMEKAISDGKSSIQNQWDFNNKVNTYLSSTDLGRSFSDRYTQYIDVQKKWFDVLKTLHSDLREEDIPYVRNADGSINYNQTAAAMQRISKETVSAEKIENALRASLTPDELNQLSIDGRYQFRGLDTPEKLTVYATSKYNKLIADNDARIKELQGLVNLSQSNPKTQKQAQDAIASLTTNNETLRSQMQEEIDYITANPEEAKSTIYKNGAIAQFARANAWEHNKSNLLTNPILEAEHWERKFALDQSEFAFERQKFSWTQYKDKFDMDMKQKDYNLKVQELMANLYGTSGEFASYTGENTNIKDPYYAIFNDIKSLNKEADSEVQSLAKTLNVSVGQVEEAIRLYNTGTKEDAEKANKIIPTKARGAVDIIVNKRSEASRLKSGLDDIEKEVYEENPELVSQKPKPSMARQSPYLTGLGTVSSDIQKKINEKLLTRGGKYIPMVETITFGSDKGNIARRTWEQIASNALYKYKGPFGSTPGASEEISKDDVTKGLEWVSGKDKEDVLYKRVTQGRKSYVLLIKDGEEVMIPLTDIEAGQLPVSKNQPSRLYQDVTEAQYFGKGSTNPTGDFAISYFNRSYFPNVKNLNIKADFDWDLSNTAKQYVTLRLNTPKGVLPLQLDDHPMSRDEAIGFIQNLNDTKIKSLYLNSNSVPEEWKEYIKTMK